MAARGVSGYHFDNPEHIDIVNTDSTVNIIRKNVDILGQTDRTQHQTNAGGGFNSRSWQTHDGGYIWIDFDSDINPAIQSALFSGAILTDDARDAYNLSIAWKHNWATQNMTRQMFDLEYQAVENAALAIRQLALTDPTVFHMDNNLNTSKPAVSAIVNQLDAQISHLRGILFNMVTHMAPTIQLL